jgi:hypothetical protein
MGNNNEIRQRMEICRKVLLALVWIFGIAEMIGGISMIKESYYLRPFGIAAIIVSILGSIIGHFLVNVVLAIPFILLNNGDYLAAIVPERKQLGINNIPFDKQKDGGNELGAEFIVTDKKRLFKEQSLFAEVVKYMQKGTKIKLLSEHDDSGTKWLYVETTTGEKGYCVKGDINPA